MTFLKWVLIAERCGGWPMVGYQLRGLFEEWIS